MNDIDLIKSHKLNFSRLKTLDECKEYMCVEGIGVKQVQKYVSQYMSVMNECTEFPVCVLSHMYDPKRSKFLVHLLSESKIKGLDRNYYIFTYSDQKEIYKQFENIENVNVVYISTEQKEYLTLSGKRQYILEWNQKNSHDHAFFIEDDCFNFVLPIGALGESGSFRNKQFGMSYSMTFGLWESIIKSNGLQYSGPVNNMEFAFRNLDENPFIKHLGQTVQAVHIGTKFCKERNINFDHDSGWDDYDMIIQQCAYGIGTHALIFSYNTPALRAGISVMNENSLAVRCERNTTALIKKWGLALVREDTKKGLYNAKVNWNNLRLCLKHGIDASEIIGMSHEEAKQYVKTKELNKDLITLF